jgi:hypothetical protein
MTPSSVSPETVVPDSASREPARELAEPASRGEAVLVDDLAAPGLVCSNPLVCDMAKTVVNDNVAESRGTEHGVASAPPGRVARIATLLHGHVSDLNIGILVIPLRGNTFKGESKRLALARRKRRGAERNGF